MPASTYFCKFRTKRILKWARSINNRFHLTISCQTVCEDEICFHDKNLYESSLLTVKFYLVLFYKISENNILLQR